MKYLTRFTFALLLLPAVMHGQTNAVLWPNTTSAILTHQPLIYRNPVALREQ